jgi:hypothetical protein
MACTHYRYVYTPFTLRRSVLTGFIELVQLLFPLHPFWPRLSLYINYTALPSFSTLQVCIYTVSIPSFRTNRLHWTCTAAFPFPPFWPWPSFYLNHTAMPPLVMACTHSRYVCKLFSPRRSVLTCFIELVQLLFRFRPFWAWHSLYLNHTAVPSLTMACIHSMYVYKPLAPHRFVLTGLLNLYSCFSILAPFGPFWPWPSLYINYTAVTHFCDGMYSLTT